MLALAGLKHHEEQIQFQNMVINSDYCAGPVVGGVKVFFSFIAYPFPHLNVSNPGKSMIKPVSLCLFLHVPFKRVHE